MSFGGTRYYPTFQLNGGIKTAALATGAYARIRRQFKQPIGQMEGIEEPLARLAGNAYVMDAASNLTVAGIDLGEKAFGNFCDRKISLYPPRTTLNY